MAKPDPNAAPVNDRREGVLRDPVVWKQGKTAESTMEDKDGEIVSYVKDIGNGDPGYNAAVRQVLIMKQDGTELVVPEIEITRDRKQVFADSGTEPNRRPDLTMPKTLEGDDVGGNRQERENPDAAARRPANQGASAQDAAGARGTSAAARQAAAKEETADKAGRKAR